MSSDVSDLGPPLLAIAWAFAGFATVIVGLRVYVRYGIMHKVLIDDWLILATWVLAIMDSIFCTVAVSWGLGRHIGTLQPQQVMYSTKYIYLCEFYSIMSPGIGRISYAFLLLEIVPPNKPRRRFLYCIIGIQLLVDVGMVIVSFSQCRPIHGFWDKTIHASCWPSEIQMYAGFFQGSVCSAVDLVLALFPASMFWNLQMKLSTKIFLSTLMGLGVFAMICSIVKTIELQAISETDVTHAMASLAIWWTLEAYMVLIAASIPTLRPLVSKSRGIGPMNGLRLGVHDQCDAKPNDNGQVRTSADPLQRASGPFNVEKVLNSEDGSDQYGNKNMVSVTTAGCETSSFSNDPSVITKQVNMTVEFESAKQ